MYNRFNFYKNTFAIFVKMHQPEQFTKANYVSKHGSQYVFTDAGVYRFSNHWGRVGNCRWRLEGIDYKQQTNYWGFCKWNDFYDNTEGLPLFFIEKVAEDHYSYNHRDNGKDTNLIFRTASETAKILKKIQELTSETNWAKYLAHDDFNELKRYFIHQLITTHKNFNQIRQEYLSSINLK
ncbi:MAG TPA: hypothetical protein VLY87_03760 [Flavobacterium sp.]|nr:hypothetical protein [Flavobacterium sp.]